MRLAGVGGVSPGRNGDDEPADRQGTREAKSERTDEANADLLPAGPLQGLPIRHRPAPAPASPASSAWDLLTGIPRRAAKAPQAMMLSIVAVIAGRVMAEGADNAFDPRWPPRRSLPSPPCTLKTTAMAMASAGGDGARGHNRGDDVWCVGPAIDELGHQHGR